LRANFDFSGVPLRLYFRKKWVFLTKTLYSRYYLNI
jgi:hypothetical protein